MAKIAFILNTIIFLSSCSICSKYEKTSANGMARGRLTEKAEERVNGHHRYMTRHGRAWQSNFHE